MAAARKSGAKKKISPPKKSPPQPTEPDARSLALAWFANLSSRILDAKVPELQTLIAEARTYDLIGLADALGEDSQVLALNKAANDLIQAGLDSFGPASPQGFQLQVLRDILNDS